MNNWRIKLSLLLTYFVFAILLNSVGIVILQVIKNYEVTKSAASILEGFKDLPIAVVSFLVASYLPRFGYRNSLVTGLVIVTLACLAMTQFPGFAMTKILFLAVGVGFALVKVSVYATVGLITENRQSHASFMNTIEGFFMVGVLSGYWIFGLFINPDEPKSQSWLEVYYYLAVLGVLNILLLLSTPFKQHEHEEADSEPGSAVAEFIAMLKLVKKPMVYVFVISAFLYVLIEQGIGTWLPTFNNEILKLPTDISVQVTSIFAACLAIGRLSAGYLLKRISWYALLNACLLFMSVLILLTLPMTRDVTLADNVTWQNLPLVAWLFPCIGLFMAPIYPAINSVILSALPKNKHAAMTGLIVLFSALGGTTGSLITGLVFSAFDGQTAFYLTLLPIAIIFLTLKLLSNFVSKHEYSRQEQAAS
ncbi:MFS transporter [Thalassomonas actiniarum]|uniref:MFS transporter n=1 Tax=Thalassomonas actiniarum TaxID=485447 RepID=A0AAE9YTE3_9GAMM|nr:MFS transporter [Thalassomonas actiniarum]WDD99281.1 MFS transporter [Thalassomonas actiniarum]